MEFFTQFFGGFILALVDAMEIVMNIPLLGIPVYQLVFTGLGVSFVAYIIWDVIFPQIDP